MSIVAKEGAKDFADLPVGNYQAVCHNVYDLGYQKGEYKGEPNVAHKIIIAWEVNERIVSAGDYNNKRYTINGWYTLSLGKKSNLRRDLTSWRGKEFTDDELKGFDLEKLIGVNCLLNVIHKDDGAPKISAVTSLPKGMEKMTVESLRTIPAWIQKIQDKQVTPEQAAEIIDEINEIKSAQSNGQNGSDEIEIPF